MLFSHCYKLKTIISIIPNVNKDNPIIDFLLNFSFKNIKLNSIVNKIDNFPIDDTATGFTPSIFNQAYSHNHAPPVDNPDNIKNNQLFLLTFLTPT